MSDALPATIPADPWDAARAHRWYKRRLLRGGAWVPCELEIIGERDADGELLFDERLIARVDGVPTDASDGNVPGWPWTAVEISEWRFLSDDAAWCREHAPYKPAAQPHRRVSIADAPLPF